MLDTIDSARRLGFDGVFANSMDAVGSRDLVSEYAWCCAQAMVDLSRLSEELILWTTSEFGWVTFGDDLTTGSRIDSERWSTEFQYYLHFDCVRDWTFDPSHEYQLVLYAQVDIGDWPGVTSRLVIPEPGSLGLMFLAIAACPMRRHASV